MLERNMFLFGSVDLMEGSVTETVTQLQQLQNARIQVAYEKLFDSTPIEHYIHMDLCGMAQSVYIHGRLAGHKADEINICEQELCKTCHSIHASIWGMEVDLNLPKKMSSEYAEAKDVAIKEASNILDVQNINHKPEDKELIGDAVEKIADDWLVQKQTFFGQTGLEEDEEYDQVLEQLLVE